MNNHNLRLSLSPQFQDELTKRAYQALLEAAKGFREVIDMPMFGLTTILITSLGSQDRTPAAFCGRLDNLIQLDGMIQLLGVRNKLEGQKAVLIDAHETWIDVLWSPKVHGLTAMKNERDKMFRANRQYDEYWRNFVANGDANQPRIAA